MRKGLEAEISSLKTRRLWFLYNQRRAHNIQVKKDRNKIKVEVEKIKEGYQPKADQIQSFQTEAEGVKKRLKIEERVVTSITNEMNNFALKWSETEEHRQDIAREYKGKEDRFHQHQNNLQGLHRQLEAIKNEVEAQKDQQVDDAQMQQSINQLTLEVQSIGTKLGSLQQNSHEASNKHSNLLRSLKQVSDHLERMQDTTRRRMQLLQSRHTPAYNAALWLEKNGHIFKDVVYPPICTQINVLDSAYAQYVEDRIPRADLIAFVCRNRDDVNLLKEKMDQHKWSVNIIHSGSDNISEFSPVRPVEHVKRLGFDQYLLDTIEGPPAILHYLCKVHQFHNIPVALRENVSVDKVPTEFSRFYIGDTRYHNSRSRYTSDCMTNLSTVNRPVLLTVTVQNQQLNNLKQQQLQLQNDLANNDEQINLMKDEERTLYAQLEEKRKNKQLLMTQRNHRKTLLAKYEQKKEQIKRTENDKVDLEAAAAKRDKLLKTATLKSLDLVKEYSDLTKRLSSGKHSLTRLRSLYTSLSDFVTYLTNAAQDMEEKIRTKEQELAEATIKVTESSKAGRLTLEELLKSLGLSKPEEIDVSVREQFNTGVQGLEKTEQKLTEKEAHRDCLVTADSQVVEEYNKRKHLIENLAKQLEKLRHDEENSVQHMAELRADWLNKVASLTSTINGSFSQLMARMKCAGEIKLSKPENEDDLAKYGLSICVKFRGNERLRELTAQQQSGGERAVSTALYLLALQTLSAVPFRCADEINQGMDAENERQMFTMLVEHMTDANASQYFLVTPKLLPNLPYNERVNFICVFNGPKISKQLSIKDAFEKKAKLDKNKNKMR